MPSNWSGPILVRSGSYLKNIEQLIAKHTTRVAHNALILLFVLQILPDDHPNAAVCTRATMWAMPEVASALYMAQYSDQSIQSVISRVSMSCEIYPQKDNFHDDITIFWLFAD